MDAIRTRQLRAFVAAAIAAGLAACGGGSSPTGGLGDSGPGICIRPPRDLAYSANPATYVRGTAIAASTPSFQDGTPTSFAVAPSLPAGLSLDTASGGITGVPAAIVAQTLFVVTAANGCGSTTVALLIAVNDIPPATLAYATNPGTYTTGTPIAPNAPSSTGGAVVGYAVAPPLPAGLSLDASTGVIAGAPLQVVSASYVVTASNSGGSTSTVLSITVKPQPPVLLTQPASAIVTMPATATFSATALGTGTLSYLWQMNGSAIPGATSASYTTPATTKAYRRATFTVTVSDAYGGVATSGSATLSVITGLPGFAFVTNEIDGSVSSYAVDPGTGRLRFAGLVAAGLRPVSLSLDPAGRHAYVANSGDGSVSQYTIGASGALSYLTNAVAAGNGPSFVTIAPSGAYAYVANTNGNTMSQYAIQADGALSFLPSPSVPTGTHPFSVSIHPSGGFAYVANNASNTVSQYLVGATGALSYLSTGIATGNGPTFVGIDPSGRYAYAPNAVDNTISQYAVGSNGILSPMSLPAVPARAQPFAMVLTRDGPAVATPTIAYAPDASSGQIFQFTIGPGGGLAENGSTLAGTNPESLAVDPSGRYVYVANFGDGTLSQFSVTASGALLPMTPPTVPAGSQPGAITVDPWGRSAYAANQLGDSISQYLVGIDGALAPMETATVPTGTSPVAFTIAPSGRFAYAANFGQKGATPGSVSQYTVQMDGSLIPLAPPTEATGHGASDVAVDPSGRYAYVTNQYDDAVSQYTIGPTGALTPMATGTVASGKGPQAVVVDPSGRYAYVANFTEGSISQYWVGASGGLTPMWPLTIPSGAQPNSIEIDVSGTYVYVACSGDDGGVSQYRIDPDTGSLVALSPPFLHIRGAFLSIATGGTWR